MNGRDFDELAGRIEAVARLTLNLVAVLEDSGLMDGRAFASNIRNGLPRAEPGAEAHQEAVLEAAACALQEMADSIDFARSQRQSGGR